MLATGEARSVWSEPDLRNPTFLLVAGLSGAIGFGIRRVRVAWWGRGSCVCLTAPPSCLVAGGCGGHRLRLHRVRRPGWLASRRGAFGRRESAFARRRGWAAAWWWQAQACFTHPPTRPPAHRSFTSLWFLSTTTPSIYSLVGSLNKVPLALIGLLAFNLPWTLPNLLSILVGTLAGVVFAVAKSRG